MMGWVAAIPLHQILDASSEAESRLKDFAQFHLEDMSVQRALRHGDSATDIERYAEEHRIGLTAMPTHGGSRSRNAPLGSVAAKALQDASCAVWTSAHVEQPRTLWQGWRSILCAIDSCPRSIIRTSACPC